MPSPAAADISRGIVGGLVASILTLTTSLSFAALVFSGPLAGGLHYGVSATLLTAGLMSLVLRFLSSTHFTVGGTNGNSSAIYALLGGGDRPHVRRQSSGRAPHRDRAGGDRNLHRRHRRSAIYHRRAAMGPLDALRPLSGDRRRFGGGRLVALARRASGDRFDAAANRSRRGVRPGRRARSPTHQASARATRNAGGCAGRVLRLGARVASPDRKLALRRAGCSRSPAVRHFRTRGSLRHSAASSGERSFRTSATS